MFHETENKIEPFHPGFQHLYSNFVYDVNFHFENVIDAISVKSSYFVLRLRFYLLMILVVFCCCCYLTGRSSAEQGFFFGLLRLIRDVDRKVALQASPTVK